MEILFNELSLAGQFSDTNSFVLSGLLPFIGVLKEMQGFSTLLFKRSDVWSRFVTPTDTLHSILVNDTLRNFDEIRRLKSAIADLTKEPFWDPDTKQDPDDTFNYNGEDMWGSSLAEACERDKVTASFLSSMVSGNPLQIKKNSNTTISLLNLTRSGELTEHLWAARSISFEWYVRAKFSSGKLDFSRVDPRMGFDIIQPNEQSIFVTSFNLFEASTWDQILQSDGLRYSEYHGQLALQYNSLTTYKFRVSQKMRCHGYRSGQRFVVIGFETDHFLSDRG